MSVLTAGFEKGTNGAAILATDGGDASAFDVVTGSPTYSTDVAAHGTQSCKLVSGATSRVQWSTSLGTVGDLYGRFYLYMTALPGATATLVNCNASSNGVFLQLTSSGLLVVLVPNSGNQAVSTTILSTATWYRIEYHFTIGASGLGEVKIFSGDSTTAIETFSKAGTTAGTTVASLQMGNNGNVAWSLGYQDCLVGNATAYPGPFPNFAVAPAVSGSAPVGSTLTCDGGTQSGTFTLSYQWTSDGSNIAGATSSTYVTQAGDATHAIGCTVTATGQQATSETASSTSSNTITVTAASSLSTVVGKTGTSGTAVMQKAASGWTYITGKKNTSGTAVDQKGLGGFTKIKGH